MYEIQTVHFFVFKFLVFRVLLAVMFKKKLIRVVYAQGWLKTEFVYADSRDQVKIFIFLIINYFTLATSALQAG